jgi:hypothetical protein
LEPASIFVLVLTGLTVLDLVFVEINSRRNMRKESARKSAEGTSQTTAQS